MPAKEMGCTLSLVDLPMSDKEMFRLSVEKGGAGAESCPKVRGVNGRCIEGASSMEPDADKRARIAALNEEMDAIYFADRRYWERGQAVTSKERAEYQGRQDRLEEIRKELAQLRSA
jgi:hypothetical protein